MATNTANNIFNVNPDVSQPFWKNLTQNVFYPAAYLNQLPTETLAGMALGAPLGILGSDWLVNYINRGKKNAITPKTTFDTKVKYNVNGKPYTLDELQKIYGADNVSPKLNPSQNEQPADVQSVQQQFNWADNAGIPKDKQTAISFPGGKVSREDYDWYTGVNWQDRNYSGTDWISKIPQQGESLSSYVSRMNFQDNLNNNSWENIIKRKVQPHLDKFRQSATPILYPPFKTSDFNSAIKEYFAKNQRGYGETYQPSKLFNFNISPEKTFNNYYPNILPGETFQQYSKRT